MSHSTILTVYHVGKLHVRSYEQCGDDCEDAGYNSYPQVTLKDSLSKPDLDLMVKEFKWVKTKLHGVMPSLVVLCYDVTIQSGQLSDAPGVLGYQPRKLLIEHWHDPEIVTYLGKHAESLKEADEMRRYYKHRKELFDPQVLTLDCSHESVIRLYPTDEMIREKLAETLEQERKEEIKRVKRNRNKKRRTFSG